MLKISGLPPKEFFSEKEVFSNCWKAAIGRVARYKKGVTEEEKNKLKSQINSIIFDYYIKFNATRWSGESHINYLQEIKNQIDNSLFKKNQITFGVVQKLFNLYLKYKWIFGNLNSEPPHCPVDSQILKIIGTKEVPWSKMTKEQYQDVIIKCKMAAKGTSLAQWELEQFNKINYWTLRHNRAVFDISFPVNKY